MTDYIKAYGYQVYGYLSFEGKMIEGTKLPMGQEENKEIVYPHPDFSGLPKCTADSLIIAYQSDEPDSKEEVLTSFRLDTFLPPTYRHGDTVQITYPMKIYLES